MIDTQVSLAYSDNKLAN
jgi:hypothetical protein